MIIYKKGWYSVCNCENLNLELTKKKEIVSDLAEKVKKYIFILKKKEDEFIRYETIRKTWIRIDSYDETGGLIQRKMTILKRQTFDYYGTKNLIIFHSGINKVRSVIRYLNNELNQKCYHHNHHTTVPPLSYIHTLSSQQVLSLVRAPKPSNLQ